jgi:hypothetical protein
MDIFAIDNVALPRHTPCNGGRGLLVDKAHKKQREGCVVTDANRFTASTCPAIFPLTHTHTQKKKKNCGRLCAIVSLARFWQWLG